MFLWEKWQANSVLSGFGWEKSVFVGTSYSTKIINSFHVSLYIYPDLRTIIVKGNVDFAMFDSAR